MYLVAVTWQMKHTPLVLPDGVVSYCVVFAPYCIVSGLR